MPPDAFADWFRWAVGLFFAIQTALIGHLYTRIDSVRKEYDERTGQELKNVWVELSRLRQAIEDDRQRGADGRTALAASIVTRDEMERQVNRLVDLVNAQISELRKGVRG